MRKTNYAYTWIIHKTTEETRVRKKNIVVGKNG